MTQTSGSYIPGTCNIGPKEIARRKQAAYLGLFLTLITAVALLVSHSSHLARTLLIIPAMVFAVGLVQSNRKFCLAFGLAGLFNFGDLGSSDKVASKADRQADRKTALGILAQSFVIAFLITSIVVLLP